MRDSMAREYSLRERCADRFYGFTGAKSYTWGTDRPLHRTLYYRLQVCFVFLTSAALAYLRVFLQKRYALYSQTINKIVETRRVHRVYRGIYHICAVERPSTT